MKLLDTIFAKESPEQFLQPPSLLANLADSCLEKFLSLIYEPLLANFLRLSFREIKDFLRLYHRMLKLTNRLLAKFKDVLPQMKAGLSHRYPQYDEFLRIAQSALNSQSVEQLVINSLLLQEEALPGGHTSGLTNKLWLEQLKQGGQLDDAKQRARVHKLICQALQCLNTLLDLSYLQIQAQKVGATLEQRSMLGARAYYCLGLNCVSNVANLVRFPGQWEQYNLHSHIGGNLQYSLFSIVQYYVKPHLHLCPYMTRI